jgi:hypothetical protein
MFAAAAGAVIATLAVAVAVIIGEDTFPPRYAFRYFSDAELTRALRMKRAHFYKLVRTLGIELERDAVQGARSSGGRIEPDVRLAVTLRLLSGGSAWDLMQVFRLGRSTVCDVFHATLDSVMKTLHCRACRAMTPTLCAPLLMISKHLAARSTRLMDVFLRWTVLRLLFNGRQNATTRASIFVEKDSLPFRCRLAWTHAIGSSI